VKTSINVNDGVIDVDVPFPDYITSFETAVSSPSSSGYLSTPGFGTGFDAFEQSCRVAVDGDSPVNVAGWLQHYHPDFVLQALPAQEGIIDQIKASMKAEPTPAWRPNAGSPERDTERWVDVSTVLIADTTTFSLKRIRYRRLVRRKPISDRNITPIAGSYNSAVVTPMAPTSPDEIQVKEEFNEEPIFELDDILAEAVEKVIAMGADISKGGSGASSRSTSKRRERRDSTSTQSDAQASHGQSLSASLGPTVGIQEVPRSQCKAVLLSALEEVIREVIDERDAQRERAVEQMEGLGAGERERGRYVVGGRGRPMETVLREAIRMWLEGVDAGGEHLRV